MELLDKPYLKGTELARLLDTSSCTVSRLVKDLDIKRWPWGYSTDEIIKKINLQPYINRQKKKSLTANKQDS